MGGSDTITLVWSLPVDILRQREGIMEEALQTVAMAERRQQPGS
jgi:hypothetical protein